MAEGSVCASSLRQSLINSLRLRSTRLCVLRRFSLRCALRKKMMSKEVLLVCSDTHALCTCHWLSSSLVMLAACFLVSRSRRVGSAPAEPPAIGPK